MQSTLEVLLSPAEFALLPQRDLSRTTCVVIDILRATSSMVTALASGAKAIIPVGEIEEALELRHQDPTVLLAGERDGFRIRADQTGGTEFDLGNSPREFTTDKVEGRTIVLTTTNGTRGLRACAKAESVLLGTFLNLRPTLNWIRRAAPEHLILICSGTIDQPALEDVLCAGAICEQLWPMFSTGQISDGAEMARRLYPLFQHDLAGAMRHARNGRRLLANVDLRPDVRYCMQRETVVLVAGMDANGVVRKL